MTNSANYERHISRKNPCTPKKSQLIDTITLTISPATVPAEKVVETSISIIDTITAENNSNDNTIDIRKTYTKNFLGESYENQILLHFISVGYEACLWKFIPEKHLIHAGIIWSANANLNKKRTELAEFKEETALENNPEIINGVRDTGVDILIKNPETGEYIVVQCKNYADSNTVTQNKLAGFFRHQLYYNIRGIVTYTSKLSKYLLRFPPEYNKTEFQLIPYDLEYAEKYKKDLEAAQQVADEKFEKTIKTFSYDEFHPYQKRICDNLRKLFDDEFIEDYDYDTEEVAEEPALAVAVVEPAENNAADSAEDTDEDDEDYSDTFSESPSSDSQYTMYNKAIMEMPCGTGKTAVAALLAADYDYVIIFSPLKIHTTQNYHRMRGQTPHSQSIIIDSDNTSREDDIKGIHYSRNFEEITAKLGELNKWFISSTFDSADVVLEFLNTLDPAKFARLFIVVDEFHLLSRSQVLRENENIPSPPMFEILAKNIRILYMSATPRVYEMTREESFEDYQFDMENYVLHPSRVMRGLNDSQCDVKSDNSNDDNDDDKDDKDKYTFRYTFEKAIKNKDICDIRVFLPRIYKNIETKEKNEAYTVNHLMEYIPDISTDDVGEVEKTEFLLNAMKMEGIEHVIVYFNEIKDTEDFAKIAKKMAAEYFGFRVITDEDKYNKSAENNVDTIWFGTITSKDNYNMRRKKQKMFENPNIRTVLLSVELLNEAVDLPMCDGVYFTEPVRNKAKIIQRVGRAIRKVKSKPNKKANVLVWGNEEDDWKDIICQLKETIPNMNEKIRFMNRQYAENVESEVEYKRHSDVSSSENNDRERKWVIGVEEFDLIKKFKNNVIRLKEWINNNHDNPNKRSINIIERKNGFFLTNCRGYKNNHRNWSFEKEQIWNDEFGNLDLLKKKDIIEIFRNNVIRLKQFIDFNKRIPSIHIKHEKQLKYFIQTSKQNKKYNINWSVEKEQIWINEFGNLDLLEYKDVLVIFRNNVIQLKQFLVNNNLIEFINKYKRFERNSLIQLSGNKEIRFLNVAKKNKNNNKNWSIEKEQIWIDEFGNIDLLEKIDLFKLRVLQLKEWIEKYGQLPSRNATGIDEKLLFSFLVNTRTKKNKNILSSEYLNYWINIIGDDNLLKNNDLLENFEQDVIELKQWMNINTRIPTIKSDDNIENKFGSFLIAKRQNKKKNIAWSIERDNIWIKYFGNLDLLNTKNLIDMYYDKLIEIKNWIDIHQRKPSDHSKDKYESSLGLFIGKCKGYKKNNECWSIEKEKLWIQVFGNLNLLKCENLLEEFENKVIELKEWIHENDRIPSQTKKNKNEDRIAKFVTTNRNNKKNNYQWSVEKDSIWIKHFSNFDLLIPKNILDIFQNRVNDLYDWMIINQKKPNGNSKNKIEKSLGHFITDCKLNKKNNEFWSIEKEQIWIHKFGNLELLEYRDLLGEFRNNVIELKSWININQRIPRDNAIDPNEKIIGRFLMNSKINKKNNRYQYEGKDEIWISEFGNLDLLEYSK
jgi:superfamily II DNA or RNA helicase